MTPTQSELEKLLERSREMRDCSSKTPWDWGPMKIRTSGAWVCSTLENEPRVGVLDYNRDTTANAQLITHAVNTMAAKDEVIRVLVEALKSNERILDSIKSDLYASVYTVEDDEFEKIYACRDFATEALAHANRIAAEALK